ncbi:MAG: hypothetical protein KGL53_06385, partial [Elusimicrobia bacterium]|nr:hypothetical protein [Elusimicrobiota bacterium]
MKTSSRRAVAELARLLRGAKRFQSASELAEWDAETVMPSGGAAARGEVLGALQGAAHARLTSKDFARALGAVCDLRSGAAKAGLSPAEAALVREAYWRFDRARRLPARLVEETARAQSASQHVWVEARRRS